MHGRKRSTRAKVSEEERVEQLEKFRKLRLLNSAALKSYKLNEFTTQSLELTTKLLSVNPDVSTLWNFRRKILLHLCTSDATKLEQAQTELALTAEVLAARNPKSYSAWHHRKWVVSKFVAKGVLDLSSEVALCVKMLQADERNFHCWTYRKFVMDLQGGADPQSELGFAEQLISNNFSNYAAWHLRALHVDTTLLDSLQQEFETLHNAIFTEPADQASWIYLKWLVTKIAEIPGEQHRNLIVEQVSMCRELLELEPNSKWGLLTLVDLLKLCNSLEAAEYLSVDAEVKQLCVKLTQVDPMHKGYYSYLASQQKLQH